PGAAVLRPRQRDPVDDGALAGPPKDRALPRALVPGDQGGGPGRARDVCELPYDGIPPTAVPRPRVLQRLPRVAGTVRGVPGAPAEYRRGPAAHHERARARRAAQRRGRPGALARLAGADGVRGRMRRRVRVLLDRRVVPAWPRRGGLGLRPHARRPVAQACAGSGTRGVGRGAVLAEPAVAPDLGGRVLLQRRAHHPRLPRWVGAARLPRFRSHRGRRAAPTHRGSRGWCARRCRSTRPPRSGATEGSARTAPRPTLLVPLPAQAWATGRRASRRRPSPPRRGHAGTTRRPRSTRT